jgi:hypothetical protein
MPLKLNAKRLDTTYDSALSTAKSMRKQAMDAITASAAGPVSANVLKDMYLSCGSVKAELTAAAAKSGMNDYVKLETGDPNHVFSTEVAAINAAIDTVATWIDANVNKNANGYWIIETSNADYTISTRTYSTASLADLRTHLQALVDAI